MLYIAKNIETDEIEDVVTEHRPDIKEHQYLVSNNESNHTWEDVEKLAEELTDFTGFVHLPVDRGGHVWPRYSFTEAPKVGDFVSRGFNGDYYPDSRITKISPSYKTVTTESGNRYYRRKNTGSWKLAKSPFQMVKGNHDERNPSF